MIDFFRGFRRDRPPGPEVWPQTDQASIPRRFRNDLPPDAMWIEDAQDKALTAFWRGFWIGAVLAGIGGIAGAAWSETIIVGHDVSNGSTVTLAPSDDPGAVAVVTFRNEAVNGGWDNGVYTLDMPGLSVGIVFTWEAEHMTGADRITVVPPDGMVCQPASCEATVPEGGTGEVLLIEYLAS
jgi:hypothetical protein